MLNIIIPIYKNNFDDFEIKSLQSIFKHFDGQKITFIAPINLDISFLTQYQFINKFRVETFENYFFESIDGYNKLLLNNNFYSRFKTDKYILICQTDVFIFKNELEEWLSKDYDYIGAPWIGSKRNCMNRVSEKINTLFRQITKKKKKNTERLFKVGNGGFSLRKTQKFIDISNQEKDNIQLFINERPDNDYFIEDVFWSLYVPKKYSDYKIPEWKEALSFCIDRKPALSLKLNNNKTPMACHGFNKKKVAPFWEKYIKNNS